MDYCPLMHVIEPPPKLERVVDDKILPLRLMVCRECWQVEGHTQRVEDDKMFFSNVILNPGECSRAV